MPTTAKSSKRELTIWKHFNVEARDKKSHRKRGTCLHCNAYFHDSTLHLLQKHIIYKCPLIPENSKRECIEEKMIVESLLSFNPPEKVVLADKKRLVYTNIV